MLILYAPFARKLRGTNEPSPKDYPWNQELVGLLSHENQIVQVGGNDDKQVVQDFRKNLAFDQVSELIHSCETAICVDSYLQHHCWFLDKKAIVLWGISDPLIFGHSMHLNLLKDRNFLRPNQFDLYYTNEYKPEAFVTPKEVMENLDVFSKNGE